jgi:hypothetical protein
MRVVLARPAGTDETVLAAPSAFDLRIGERIPVGRDLREARHARPDQVLERDAGTGRIDGVLDRLHHGLPGGVSIQTSRHWNGSTFERQECVRSEGS